MQHEYLAASVGSGPRNSVAASSITEAPSIPANRCSAGAAAQPAAGDPLRASLQQGRLVMRGVARQPGNRNSAARVAEPTASAAEVTKRPRPGQRKLAQFCPERARQPGGGAGHQCRITVRASAPMQRARSRGGSTRTSVTGKRRCRRIQSVVGAT